MTSNNNREEVCHCPVGTFFKDVERIIGKKSNFVKHMTQSRIEVLKAIRSLVDERIEGLDKKRAKTGPKKMKNIKVE